jgi:hypothetical protein
VHQELFKNGVRTLIGATLKNLVKNLIGEFFLYYICSAAALKATILYIIITGWF